MPACKNDHSVRPSAARRARLLGLLLTLSAATAHADFLVQDVQAQFTEEALLLDTRIELALTPKTEEALAKGIPLDVNIEVQLIRRRTLMWDKRVADWVLRRRIQYHALSNQYLVSGLHPDVYDLASFDSLASALRHIGTLQEASLPLGKKKNISNDGDYSLEVRVFLDLEALPSVLRPVAYTSPSWHLNSGWTTWIVQR
ncbi:MAG: DUF4390 domain-containing protein [Gammaproteobacteria bacterium]|nr:DUF4390 domain-containing protein [Gammaproteobacteria bacterium]